MRLSFETLYELVKLGDQTAIITAAWLYAGNMDAQAWSTSGGNIGAGWPGMGGLRTTSARLAYGEFRCDA